MHVCVDGFGLPVLKYMHLMVKCFSKRLNQTWSIQRLSMNVSCEMKGSLQRVQTWLTVVVRDPVIETGLGLR